ncbi:DUF4259 domain-containing protein [Paenibacillus sp. P36]|uniref:DUF4259 domain-containing protein n=1 Tax=Paenibacillus sp. P36 TaxID=3342538 RepID=UPI0038B35F35
MGAWGFGIFENDEVLDWKWDLIEANHISIIKNTFDAALESDYIEADLASSVVGAAEVIAALLGIPGEEIKSGSSYTLGLEDWLNAHKGQGVEMLEPACHAIARVKSKSELLELWEETGDSSEWMEIVENLEARLKSLLINNR